MVDYVSDVTVLLQSLRRFAFSGAPEEIADRLQRLPGTDADVICDGAELLYANYDLLNDDGKRICAELFEYAVRQNWSGFNQGDRSATIVSYIGRELGDEGAIQPPAAAEWPVPQANRREGLDWRNPEAPTPDVPEGAPPPPPAE